MSVAVLRVVIAVQRVGTAAGARRVAHARLLLVLLRRRHRLGPMHFDFFVSGRVAVLPARFISLARQTLARVDAEAQTLSSFTELRGNLRGLIVVRAHLTCLNDEHSVVLIFAPLALRFLVLLVALIFIGLSRRLALLGQVLFRLEPLRALLDLLPVQLQVRRLRLSHLVLA